MEINVNISKFVLPLLITYNTNLKSAPNNMDLKLWRYYLEDMIFAFELKIKEGVFPEIRKKEDDIRYLRGLHLFAKYFDYLWI